MSNNQASNENVESPTTYGKEAYEEYRKKERRKNKNYHGVVNNTSHENKTKP